MAQGLGHSDGHLFWIWAVPCYIGGAFTCWVAGIVIREIVWLNRQLREASPSI